jgi:hypothetical protein
MKSAVAFAAAVFLLCAGTVMAQEQSALSSTATPSFSGASRASDLTKAVSGLGFGLLDPSRLQMRQSYSLSYYSGSGYSGSIGLYMNTIEYQLSRPLTVRVGLAYMHHPLGVSGSSGGSVLGNGQLLPSVGIEYRPSDNFFFSIDYRTVPLLGWPYAGTRSNGIGADLYDPWFR